MAIYAGTWEDPAHDPFDPEAKHTARAAGGGTAAVRRHSIRPHPAAAIFAANGRISRDHWLLLLSSAERTEWETEGATGSTRRGSEARSPDNGYISFSALTWLDIFTTGGTSRRGTETLYSGFTTATFDSISIPNQTATFTVNYNAEVAEDLHSVIAAYQVNPRYLLASAPVRQTRLLEAHPLPQAPPFAQTRTVALRWPVASGGTVRLYIRGRVANFYEAEFLLQLAA